MSENCIFCKIAKENNSDKFIFENENFFSIYDINPAFEGHALVISKKHFQTILDLPNSLGKDLLEAIRKTSLILKEKYNSEGFNIINNTEKIAGQIVDHFHMHVVPRNKSDNSKLDFVKKN